LFLYQCEFEVFTALFAQTLGLYTSGQEVDIPDESATLTDYIGASKESVAKHGGAALE